MKRLDRFTWKWLPLPELRLSAYANLAGFSTEALVQKRDRWWWCFSGLGQKAVCTAWGCKQKGGWSSWSTFLLPHVVSGLQHIHWKQERKLMKHWHGILSPSPLPLLHRWEKALRPAKRPYSCGQYAEIAAHYQQQRAGLLMLRGVF